MIIVLLEEKKELKEKS